MYDGRGSVSSLSGQTGGNMVQYTYDAYGVTTTINSGNSLNNPYQYNAEYTDSSTGNQYLRARYYDPTSGRFLTKDTYLGETNDPLSRNLYAYTRNNPVNLMDPSGHLFGTIMAIIAVGAAIYGTYKAVTSHNEQSAQIRNQQQSYERRASRVQENVTTAPKNLKAPTSPNQKGSFSYYNARDKKVVTFTDAAAYFEYKKLCDELDKLDKDLALNIVHNVLDAAGVIPGFGEIADAANGCIYLAEGDYLNAGLSFVSCIPLAGDAAGKGGKAANTALDYSDEALDLVNGFTKYGDDVADAAGTVAKYGDDVADAAKYSDDALDAIGDATKSSKPMTWNEFQHANGGKGMSKADMSDAWSQYKADNGISSKTSIIDGNHGNARSSTKTQHGYVIYDDTGNAVKTGISGQPLNQNGTSPRANSQVNKWNKDAGYNKYHADVVEENIPNRAKALEWEQNKTNELAQSNDLNRHQRPTPKY